MWQQANLENKKVKVKQDSCQFDLVQYFLGPILTSSCRWLIPSLIVQAEH